MTDPARFLDAPLGQPGSGRVRYGAAMALYAQGQISAEVLEVYRVASAHDGRDPAVILSEMGLPVPKSGATPQPVAAPEQDKL
jgi:hypothetical protein